MNEPLASDKPGWWTRQQARHEAAQLLPKVVIYKNAKEYQKAAPKLLRQGWTASVDSTDSGRFTVTRFALAGPFALALKKHRGQLTVTWTPPA